MKSQPSDTSTSVVDPYKGFYTHNAKNQSGFTFHLDFALFQQFPAPKKATNELCEHPSKASVCDLMPMMNFSQALLNRLQLAIASAPTSAKMEA